MDTSFAQGMAWRRWIDRLNELKEAEMKAMFEKEVSMLKFTANQQRLLRWILSMMSDKVRAFLLAREERLC